MSELVQAETFAVAVKAFIMRGGKVLIVQRASDRTHNAGNWEIPGGRLELGEDPIGGLLREVEQETGLAIQIVAPLHVQSFVRDDRQFIIMITFLAKADTDAVRLSAEHVAFDWVDIDEVSRRTRWESLMVDAYKKLDMGRLL